MALGVQFVVGLPRAAVEHIEAEQPAFERAIEQRRLAGFLDAQLARQFLVRRQHEHLPPAEMRFQRLAECGHRAPMRLDLGRGRAHRGCGNGGCGRPGTAARAGRQAEGAGPRLRRGTRFVAAFVGIHAFAIGRIGHDDARDVGGCADLAGIGQPQLDARVGHAGTRQVAGRLFDGDRIDVTAIDPQAGGGLPAVPLRLADGVAAQRRPQCRIVVAQLLEREGPRQPGRDAQRQLGGFDQQRARAAIGVVQRFVGGPAGQCQQARGEVFLQGGDALVFALAPPAALEQRLARGVDVQRDLALVQEREHAHIGVDGVDRGPVALGLAQAVDDRVLDLQVGEIQAAQGRAHGGGVHAQRLAAMHEAVPLDPAGDPEDLFLVAVAPRAHLAQHAAGQP